MKSPRLGWAFIADESGASAIEYALIASLVAVALIASLTGLGSQLGIEFGEISSAFNRPPQVLALAVKGGGAP